ncbi:MAG: Nif3-like dinuclear metal center hexameric protein [Muribaculaceae bacterium]|nr:Nif3-like dinuclear metal center hexameric protein [Muribaculaceae bacterium]
MPTLTDIAAAIEEYAPLSGQESWDNSGWQLVPRGKDISCTGVMLCLDVTPDVVSEAHSAGCNLIVSHHPLIFKGVRSIADGASQQQDAIISAIGQGISVYSSHTALDCAPGGPSAWLAQNLDFDITIDSPLDPDTGLGIVGSLAIPCSPDELITAVLNLYGGGIRTTAGRTTSIRRIAICSGSGGEFIPRAIAIGADAYITSDIRYHDFLDHGKSIILVDTGHFESEICTKSIFSRIISEKFPNFAVRMCQCEHAPVAYHVKKS